MALVKGGRLVKEPKKTKKIKLRNNNDPSFPYLKDKKLSLIKRLKSPIHFFFRLFFEMNIILSAVFWNLLAIGYVLGYLPAYAIVVYVIFLVASYYIGHNTSSGRWSYYFVDGMNWFKTASLLSPTNPSPGGRVMGMQLATSRFLILPGPQSSFNGFARKVIPFMACFSAMFVIPIGMLEEINLTDNDQSLAISLTIIWFVVGGIFLFKYAREPLGQPRRFYIFDRKKQTVSYHKSFFSREMMTYPWVEFEGRSVWAYRHGYHCKLIHAPTGNVFELQGPDLHWNSAQATDAYSYVTRFMDLSQPLIDMIEFERYLPIEDDFSHIQDEKERVRQIMRASFQRDERRRKYHNPPIETVIAKLDSFTQAVKEYPWLSAKNVWAASHRYGLEPNWDKWVRDKWGLAANEDYQVPESEREGEPEWFPQFLAFLIENTQKIKHMDDDERIKFTQEWFESTFPELHWVDPVTADRYEQEEEFV